jgi:8-oxo-dGTP pyrophosphatase MutT (NUDIX family)
MTARKEKTSYGIACCRIVNGIPEILLIRKRFTYAYAEFMHGNYTMSSLPGLLNKMTIDEKHDIMSMNFQQMWYRIWLGYNPKWPDYCILQAKFTSMFGDGTRLKKLIRASKHADYVWEIPKGRRKKTETNINCAVREHFEETGISKKWYKVHPIIKSYSFVDDGVKYNNHYYVATMTRRIDPVVNFGYASQIEEVSDIKWMSAAQVSVVDKTGQLSRFVAAIFRAAKRANKPPKGY